MGAVKPAVTVPGHELNSADQARAARNTHDDFVEDGQQLKDMHVAMLNILEDATADRLRAEAAVKASLNVLEDLSAAQAKIQVLNAELEARVEQRTAELVVANKNLEAFTYSVAHDLRSPLRALSGFAEALTEDYGDRLDETGRWYTDRIQAAANQMDALIDDLLVLAQVSRVEMSLGPVDLSAEVAAIASELQAGEPGRRVRFAIHEGIWVKADRSLIRTVLQNLVENAWKFTAKRDGATIEFGATAAEDAGACCYVRDNGAGFDPAYAGKLFQPFQRLHGVTEFPGTGVGLASVRRIIERHGGRVWAEGAVGRGATFYFTLDATETHDTPPAL
jgi:light-regulated signal transduction histidine kinase (bacteriophytochrome)